MSTLKKILSLTLALAMLMSVSVFADFADQAGIDKDAVESVNKLAAFDIIKGIENEDGTMSFNPTGTIKRAEAAKMIYVLRNGGVDDGAANWVKDPASFADTDGHWAEGYIEYCKAFGIINGRTTTSFDPEAPVTGVELAKMLLVTAGYKAEVEGYSGANYADAVLQRANEVGIFDGCKFAISQPAPRQWAAKMFDNTLEVHVPTYIGDYLVTGTIGNIETVQTVSAKYLGITYAVDTVVANDTWALEGTKASDGDFTAKVLGTLDYDLSNDMVGQEVSIAYKVVDGDKVVLSVIPTGNTIVDDVVATRSGSSSDYHYHITFNGTTIDVTKASQFKPATKIYNALAAAGQVSITATEGKAFAKELYDEIFGTTTAAVSVYAIDVDGDGKLEATDYLVINETLFGTIKDFVTNEYKDSTDVAFKVEMAASEDPNVATDDLAVQKKFLTKSVLIENIEENGQVVKVAYNHKTAKTTISLADVVIGTYTGIADGTHTIGGTGYKISKYDMGDAEVAYLAQSNLGEIAKLYTDGKYVIKAQAYVNTDLGDLNTNLALLVSGYKSSDPETNDVGKPTGEYVDTYKVKVLLASGETVVFVYETKSTNLKTGELTVADLFDGDDLKATYDAGTVFEYRIGSNGKIAFNDELSAANDVVYTVSNAGATTTTATPSESLGQEVKYLYDSKLFQNTAGTTIPVIGTDETLVFAAVTEDGETEYKVVKLSSFTADQNMILIARTDKGGVETALLARVSYSVGASTSSAPYVFVTTTPTTAVEDGEVYAYFSGFDFKTGKVVSYKAEKEFYSSVSRDSIYAITVTDGVVTTATLANTDWTDGSVTAKADGLYIIEGGLYQTSGDEKTFTSTAKIYEKNSRTFTAKGLNDITVALKETATVSDADEYYENVIYILDGGKLAYVVYSANQKDVR